MKMTTPEIGDQDCRFISDILGRIGDKWTGLVVRSLRERPHRFNELKRAVHGISQQMLTRTLKALERDGIIVRTVYPTVPPQVDYALTALGHSLAEPVFRLVQWAWENGEVIRSKRDDFDARNKR
jgi:DNA-binding HxlR family transcriptional regulator